MPSIPVVENPRRRRRRAPRRRRRRTTRRRNPMLASLSGNPRRRRYYRRPRRRSYRRRYRNPRFGLMRGWDLQGAFWTAGGMVMTKALPDLVRRWWPAMPTMGITSYAVKAGIVAGAGWLTGMLPVRNKKLRQQQVVTGGLALIMYELYQEYLAPKLGMGSFITEAELQEAGVGGFIAAPTGMSGYGGKDGYAWGLGRYGDVGAEILAS